MLPAPRPPLGDARTNYYELTPMDPTRCPCRLCGQMGSEELDVTHLMLLNVLVPVEITELTIPEGRASVCFHIVLSVRL